MLLAAEAATLYATRAIIAECAAVQYEDIQDFKIMALAADTFTMYAARNA